MKLYERGTLVEYQAFEASARLSQGITAGGKIGYVSGIATPDNQRVMSYSKAIPHPTNNDDCIWAFGQYPDGNKTQLTFDEAKTDGWFDEV